MDKSLLIKKVLKTFIFSLGIATLGAGVGKIIPFSSFLPLGIFNLVLSLGALLFRKIRKMNYTFLFLCSFLTGVTISPLITYYVKQDGWHSILLALLITILIFDTMAESGWRAKRDLFSWNENLFSALLALVLLILLSFVFSFGSAGRLVMSLAGIIIFSCYVKYDFNMMRRLDFTEEDIPLMAFNLCLSFFNLFL